MKRKRLFILDEAIESCRLMPISVQYVFATTMIGMVMLNLPLPHLLS